MSKYGAAQHTVCCNLQKRTALEVRDPEISLGCDLRGAGSQVLARTLRGPKKFVTNLSLPAHSNARPETATSYKGAHTTQPKTRSLSTLSYSAMLSPVVPHEDQLGPLRHTQTIPSGATMLPSRVQTVQKQGQWSTLNIKDAGVLVADV